MSGQRDINKDISVATTVAPAAALTATTTGAAVDLAGFRSAAVVVHIGVVTDGTFVASLEEADAVGGPFTAVAAAGLSGAFADITAAADETIQEIGYLGSKRFIRLVLTETVASTGALVSATVLRADPLTKPQ